MKRVLHLPQQTANAYFYAKTRDGGLGLISLACYIPVILRRRLQALRGCGDSISDAVLATEYAKSVISRLDRQDRYHNTAAIKKKFADELEGSYSGHGLSQGSCSASSGHWVRNPPPYWTERDYVRAA